MEFLQVQPHLGGRARPLAQAQGCIVPFYMVCLNFRQQQPGAKSGTCPYHSMIIDEFDMGAYLSQVVISIGTITGPEIAMPLGGPSCDGNLTDGRLDRRSPSPQLVQH
jgi:hypothetical protein